MARIGEPAQPNEGIEQFLGDLAARMVEASRRRPRIVVVLSLLLTIVSAYLAATRLQVDTDPDLLTSPELPFRQTNAALEEAFPMLQDNLIVLVEATESADARAAAEELADLLRLQPDRYPEVFLPGDDPFFDDNGLFYLERETLDDVAERIDESGELLATLADRQELPTLIAAITHVLSGEEGLDGLGEDGGRILEEVATAVDAFDRGESAAIDWGELLFDDLDADWDEMQVIFISSDASLATLDPALVVIGQVRAVADQLEPRPGLKVRLTGDMVVQSEEMSLVLHEVALAGIASLVLVTLILWYALESFRLLMATVLALVAGLFWTAGFAAVAIGHLNVLTVAFAVLYIGLGADFGIHLAMGYLEHKTGERGISTALRATGRRVGASLAFCALTTAIGFYAFIPTSYVAVAELGIISGTGVFLSLFATLTTYVALIALGLGGSEKIAKSRLGRIDISLPTFPLTRPRLVCALSLLTLAACLLAIQYTRFDMNPLNVRDPRVDSVQAMKDLLTNEDISAWTIQALVDDIDEASALASRLEASPEINEVYTLRSFLPDDVDERLVRFAQMRKSLSEPVELTEEERGEGRDLVRDLRWTIEGYGVALDLDAELRFGEGDDDPLVLKAERLREALSGLHAKLPDEDDESGEVARKLGLARLEQDVFGDLREVVDEVLEHLPTAPIGLADLPASLARRYVAPDGRARVEILSSTNLHVPGALEAFTDLVYSEHEAAGGAVVATVELGRSIVASLRQALAMAVVAIVGLLLVLWRSLKYALITVAPLLIGGVMTAAFTVVAYVPFNFANVIVLPLILGMGVDGGIHLVHRHRTGLGTASNLLRTATARAVLFSALTTIVSFATLGISHHMGIASLAQLLAAGITFMTLANVIVLPSLLVLADPRAASGEALASAPKEGAALDAGDESEPES
jgi:hypothetical protein